MYLSRLHLLVTAISLCDAAPLTIQTTTGLLTGFINSTAPSVRQFLGIPYAQPPVGPLRFKPPVKNTNAAAARNATAFGPSCMQPAGFSGPAVNLSDPNTSVYALMPQFQINNGISEDCLTLNVYAPASPASARLPVFVWIHGGAFVSGGSDILYQIPDQWVQRTQGHIFVTMNYRLGVFGFPNAKGQRQNVGLLDQRMVVEWARDNIAAFGGDPSRMVIMGQSAGSAAVNMYAYSYVTDPIVSGFIGHSGAAGILTTADTTSSNFTSLASVVGCGNLAAAAELACMQDASVNDIQSAVNKNPTLSFVPVGDNVTAPANPMDRLAKGLVAKKPFLMGNTDNEGGGFSTIGGETPETRAFGLQGLACPVIAEADARVQYGYSTYRYLYAGNFTNISPLPWIAACHSCDLPLIFGTHYEYDNTHTAQQSTPLEWETSYAMEDLWLAFASNPIAPPSIPGYTWPQYNPSTTSIALFASEKGVQSISKSWFDGNCTVF